MGRVDDAMRRAAGQPVLNSAEITPEADAGGAPVLASVGLTDELEPAAGSEAAQPDENSDDDDVSLEAVNTGLLRKVVIDDQMLPASREQYRRLAATLHHAQAATGIRVIMIASAVPSEGKTLTATNLALTLSESYQRSVLLIDADLRRPTLHDSFKIVGTPGLAEGLMSPDGAQMKLHQVSHRLTILPAGRPTGDPMAILTSARMRRLIDEAREAFGWVIVDTPPIGLLTDANLLAGMVDGTVLVVKAGSTPYQLVKKAAEAIGVERILGVVLNRAEFMSGRYGYGYPYYGYSDYSYRSSTGHKLEKP